MLYHVGFDDFGSQPKHFDCIHYGRQLPLYALYEWKDSSTTAEDIARFGWQPPKTTMRMLDVNREMVYDIDTDGYQVTPTAWFIDPSIPLVIPSHFFR
jgi:hypothetical protein